MKYLWIILTVIIAASANLLADDITYSYHGHAYRNGNPIDFSGGNWVVTMRVGTITRYATFDSNIGVNYFHFGGFGLPTGNYTIEIDGAVKKLIEPYSATVYSNGAYTQDWGNVTFQ